MKQCPYCRKKFNWWDRATGQYKEHVVNCHVPRASDDVLSRAYTCRGCPAGCFDDLDLSDKEESERQL
jgi:hypothetical protein